MTEPLLAPRQGINRVIIRVLLYYSGFRPISGQWTSDEDPPFLCFFWVNRVPSTSRSSRTFFEAGSFGLSDPFRSLIEASSLFSHPAMGVLHARRKDRGFHSSRSLPFTSPDKDSESLPCQFPILQRTLTRCLHQPIPGKTSRVGTVC